MTTLPAPVYAPNARLYKYNLVSRLGQGQFGQVWLANDLTLQRQYAVKILNPGVPVDQRLKEAQISNRLQHDNLVHVYQADVVPHGNDHVVLLAMEYLPDGSVVQRLNPANFLPLSEVLSVGKQVLQGLDYLHANSFYHNDIKPENIMVGQAGQAVLTDYGIMGISTNGQPTAAPNAYRFHMAPEVMANGQINVQTDIFQTGLTLYRLASGLSSLRAKQAAMGWNDYHKAIGAGRLLDDRDFPAFVPNSLRRIIQKSVNPDPAQRYQSALDMRRAIEKLAFPGHWTTDATGNLIGYDQRHKYRLEKSPNATRFDVTGYKRNLKSGRETRVSDFSVKGATERQADALIDKFVKFVVRGK
ncbi:MAG: serine/threonine protein kinase [Alphaproteobacteria bacterium]|nr:serine/threonine protein kinase [Alphaproteobacteria bacterium]